VLKNIPTFLIFFIYDYFLLFWFDIFLPLNLTKGGGVGVESGFCRDP